MITRSQSKKIKTMKNSTNNHQVVVQEKPITTNITCSEEKMDVSKFLTELLTNITKNYTQQLINRNVTIIQDDKKNYSIYIKDLPYEVEISLYEINNKDDYNIENEWKNNSTIDNEHDNIADYENVEEYEDDCDYDNDDDYIPTQKEFDYMEDMKMYYENVFIYPKSREFIKKTQFMSQIENYTEEDNEDIESVATTIQESDEDDYDSSSDYYPSDKE